VTSQPVILTCAVTGSVTVPAQSPAIPVTPEQIVDAAVAAHEAGAAIVHVHVREPDTGRPTPDPALFAEVITGITARCDAIIVPTTGGAMGQTMEERARVVTRHRPEMATFNAGSMNFGVFGAVRHADDSWQQWEIDYMEGTRDYVFRNSFKDLEGLMPLFAAAETKPEFEAYDVGHLYNIEYLVKQGLARPPLHIQYVLGVLGGNAARVEQLTHMHDTATRLFGDGFTWSVAATGYPAEFHLGAVALVLGGNMRVGLEDNLRIAPGQAAESNAQLVEKAVALATLLDRPVATSAQARGILGLKGQDKVVVERAVPAAQGPALT
jgi:uncharacterized protein (DUF849 family)